MSEDNDSYPLAQFRKTYFEECTELLESLQANLEQLSAGEGDAETLHAIFRAVHSIKGGAGAFGFNTLISFAHVFESLLDALREDRLATTPDLTQLLMRASDRLSDIVNAARSDAEVDETFGADLVAAMQKVLGEASDNTRLRPSTEAQQLEPVGGERNYLIKFAPHTEMLLKANEPLLLFKQLRKLGELDVEIDVSHVVGLGELDPEAAYFSWTLKLRTGAGPEAVHDVFEFVEDDCCLSIEIFEEKAAEQAEASTAQRAPAASSDQPAPQAAAASRSIRVDVDRVDRLVNLVGELVITQAMLTEQALGLPAETYPTLIQGIEALAQSARELQESVMAIRAQPVKSVFARMPRVVRDLAAALGKEVRILTSGEMTEIDKTVIEQLNDPLTHMIRNALDHGIEKPGDRVSAGKPRQGTIHLSAAQRSGRIVIEVSDDGRGINRDKVLAKAREKGLVSRDASLSDEEIDNLIFEPAFSTADVVSNVSGRGVGMDVVKKNVQALGGRITVKSTLGTGSTFTLSLPLTLAVADGMVASVGGETFILPLTAIVESLRPQPADIHPVVGRGDVMALRGEYLPLLYLHNRFSIEGAVTDPCRGIVIVVQEETAGRIGVVVDELLGQQQVVVKSLEANYEPVEGVSGATILGNGRVALILDVARLCETEGDKPGRPSGRPRFDKKQMVEVEKEMTNAA